MQWSQLNLSNYSFYMKFSFQCSFNSPGWSNVSSGSKIGLNPKKASQSINFHLNQFFLFDLKPISDLIWHQSRLEFDCFESIYGFVVRIVILFIDFSIYTDGTCHSCCEDFYLNQNFLGCVWFETCAKYYSIWIV